MDHPLHEMLFSRVGRRPQPNGFPNLMSFPKETRLEQPRTIKPRNVFAGFITDGQVRSQRYHMVQEPISMPAVPTWKMCVGWQLYLICIQRFEPIVIKFMSIQILPILSGRPACVFLERPQSLPRLRGDEPRRSCSSLRLPIAPALNQGSPSLAVI